MLFKFKNKRLLHQLHPEMFSKDNQTAFWELIFKSQSIAMPSSHRFFLKIEVLTKDPSFPGLFESRLKFLRDKIESYYLGLQDQQNQRIRALNLKQRIQQSRILQDISLASIQVSFDNNPDFFDSKNFDSTGGTDTMSVKKRSYQNPEEQEDFS